MLKWLYLVEWVCVKVAHPGYGRLRVYQGFGGFVGNIIMGIVFGCAYHRWGRVMPLIVAHWVLDIVSFVGYPLALAWFPQWFG